MGPHNLHKEFICRNMNEKRDGQRQSQLKDLKGIIGVDASGWFHRSVHTQKGAAVYDMNPKVPLFDAFDKFMTLLNSVINTRENGEHEVILFMDGRSHPLKEANEGKRREQRLNTALNDLKNIYEHGDAFGTYDTVKKLRTAIAKRRDDFTAMVAAECQKIGVHICCAPFEADWQLIEAQHAGLIDIILSEDGDLFVIGGDKIVTDIDYVTGECCLYERSDILQRESMGNGSYADFLPALSNFLGNDYIDRLDGNGPVAVRSLMGRFVDSQDDTEREMILEELEITKKWNRNDQRHAEHYTRKFWNAYYLQLFPPVFRLKPKPDGTRSSGRIDIANEDTYDVMLEPLHELPNGVSKLKWGEMIGFGCDLSTLLQGDARDLFHLKLMPETGSLPAVLEQPTSEYEPHYKVAHGANPDMTMPVEYWSDWALTTFLIERGLRMRGNYDRPKSIGLAKRIISLMNKQGERCQGRYGSEVYNKRTNDYTYLHDKVPRSHFPHFEHVLNWATFKANLCQPFLIPNGCDDYFPTDTRHLQRPSKKARACKSILSQPVTRDGNGTRGGESVTERPLNYFEAAMPIRYFELGLDKVGLLMDGKDCVTDTVRVNSFISRSQYSDKMHCSAARYIMWVLPCGLSVTYTPVFLGRTSEKALVEYWGGSTYNQLHI